MANHLVPNYVAVPGGTYRGIVISTRPRAVVAECIARCYSAANACADAAALCKCIQPRWSMPGYRAHREGRRHA